jgi:hypothetical protein
VNDAGKEWAGARAVGMLERAEKLQKFFKAQQEPAASAKPSGSATASTMDLLDMLPAPPAEGEQWGLSAVIAPLAVAKPELVKPGFLPNSLTASFVRGPGRVSKEEERVLILGNRINGRSYERMYAPDADEGNFAGGEFTDPDGQPRLSDKHKAAGAVWARPSQLLDNPTVLAPPMAGCALSQRRRRRRRRRRRDARRTPGAEGWRGGGAAGR